MFSNFIYFIIALITLSLYQPTETPPLTPFEVLISFICITVLFSLYTRNRFQRLAKSVGTQTLRRLDQRFSQLSTHHSILALVAFATNIWVLDLPSYFSKMVLFTMLPSLKDLLFLMIFVGYLIIVWHFAFDAHQSIYKGGISRKTYVHSNIAFSVPILIPWICLFGVADLLQLLPFDQPKQFLNTSTGQTAYFLLFLIIAAVFAPVLVQRFWRCRPLEDGPFRRRIAQLCQRAGVTYADIVYWPIFGGRMITAGVMGLVGRFRYILVTDALLNFLEPEEVDQVIAHEIGHVKRKHLLLYLLFFVGFMLISYLAFPLSYSLLFFFQPVLNLFITFKLNPSDFYYPLGGMLLITGIIIYFRFGFGYFIRNFERQADLFVFQLFSTAQPLISTFNKIVASSGQPADKPNWHHFSIQQRVDYLHRCERAPVWIDKHDRKIKFSIALFLILFSIMAVGTFQLNQIVYNQNSRSINLSALENYLAQKSTPTKEDALLYGMLGNIYLQNNNIAPALDAYEKAIAINPNQPDILNNLAWTLATAQEPQFRNPSRALLLARSAVNLKPAPHIWDTLAEAFYANGRYDDAINAEKKALSSNTSERSLYEAQLNKFQKALQDQQQQGPRVDIQQ